MSLKNAIQEDQKTTTIEQQQLIYITKKTVRFGSDIYQFRNVTGFGLAPVPNSAIIPKQVIFALVGVGLLALVAPGVKGLGVLLLCLAAAAVFLNMSQPKKYGLKLYVNSGDNTIFVSSDISGIKSIVEQLYELMEGNIEESFVVNIDQRHASIGVGYAEKVRS